MKTWWAGLAPRERAILAAGLAVLVVLMLWLLVWEPIAKSRAELRAEVATLSAELGWMEQVADRVRRKASQGSDAASAAAGGSVLTLVEVAANASGIKANIERVQPEGQGARLWFDQVGFDRLIAWLGQLEQRHGLKISQLAVDARGEAGMVSARVLVEPR
ncbi:general secretion pathway protein M [Halopseudomonas xinjiangensis]|uniref:Type II secretion system protein M n=1 Tax=Halopseudomonas xinjiangensis TaxID=487184 RepID=A0A1H1UB79_9GAMM|nr:type II secretion system protein M [Halopseudomonas xinjiangensis]SDS69673.1 general secretion pathway protein M [Halopseudomonas xinjiangensis]